MEVQGTHRAHTGFLPWTSVAIFEAYGCFLRMMFLKIQNKIHKDKKEANYLKYHYENIFKGKFVI